MKEVVAGLKAQESREKMKLFFVLPEATIQSRKVSSIESSFHVFRRGVREVAAAAAVLSFFVY